MGCKQDDLTRMGFDGDGGNAFSGQGGSAVRATNQNGHIVTRQLALKDVVPDYFHGHHGI